MIGGVGGGQMSEDEAPRNLSRNEPTRVLSTSINQPSISRTRSTPSLGTELRLEQLITQGRSDANQVVNSTQGRSEANQVENNSEGIETNTGGQESQNGQPKGATFLMA